MERRERERWYPLLGLGGLLLGLGLSLAVRGLGILQLQALKLLLRLLNVLEATSN